MVLRRSAWIKAATLIASALLTLSLVYAATFVDNTQAEFNNGTYANTTQNGSAVILANGNTSGTYTSQVFDAGASGTWNNISWNKRTIETFDSYLTSAFHLSVNQTAVFAKDESYYLTDMKDSDKRFYLNFTNNLTNNTVLKIYAKLNSGVAVGIYDQTDTAGNVPLGIFTVTSATGEWYNITLNISTSTDALWLGEGIGSGTDPKENFDYIYAEVLSGNNLTFQVRNCSSADCSGASFSGTYNTSPQDLNVNGRYFQYKVSFSSDDASTTPELNNVTIDYTVCITNLVNTSWSSWTNVSCLVNNTMNQSRTRTQYDDNDCGEVANQTFTEYNTTLSCNYSTSAPIIQSTTPTNTSSLAAGTTSTVIKLTTNEIAICRYNTTNTTWGNMTQLNNTNSTGHNFTVTGLSNGNTYNYYFLCEDNESNRMANSYHLQFSVSNPSDGGSSGGGGGGGGGSSKKYQCNDKKDNDGDGLVDLSDPGCSGRLDDDESDEVVEEPIITLKCIESWSCSEWYACANDVQARTCIDANSCGTKANKPEERRECEEEPEIKRLIENEFKEYRFEAEELERFSFEYNGKTHHITVQVIKEDSIDVVIESDPIELTLRLEKPENVDIDFDGSSDVRIILKEIKDGKAIITLRIIGGGIGSVTGEAIKVLPYNGPNPYYLIPTIMLLIIFIVLMSIKKTHPSPGKKKFITVLDLTLMGLIFLLFMSAVIKKLPIGAFLDVTAEVKSMVSTMTIAIIIIAFILAAIAIGMIIIEKKKLENLNKKEKRYRLRHILHHIRKKRSAKAIEHKHQHHIVVKRRPNQRIVHSLKKIYKL